MSTPKTLGKLTRNIFISGEIEVITGLHIGGNKSALEIGGVDLSILKTGKGVPYIPGSSIKGKLRSILAKLTDSPTAEDDIEEVKEVFGSAGKNDERHETLLKVDDAYLKVDDFEKQFPNKDQYLDFEYSEVKMENTVDRIKGTAQHPRQIERVPAGAKFKFTLIYKEFENNKDKTKKHLNMIETALNMLEDDYLGGMGTRGSGRVRVTITERKQKTIDTVNFTYDEEAKDYVE